MKRRLFCGVLAVMLILLLAGCGCSHVWLAATCTAPRTCELCGETQGLPLGHTYQDATCTEAKTCTVCKATEGEPLGHTYRDATCTEAKFCTVCDTVEGEPLGHSWQEATTEAPQTCESCGLTEGDKINTDPRFKTAETKPLHGMWITTFSSSGDDMGVAEGFEDLFNYIVRLEFGKSGKMKMTIELEDEETFMEAYREYQRASFYAMMSEFGYSKEQADEQILEETGMTTEEYIDYRLESFDMTAFLQAISFNGVYYVEDGKLYSGMTWSDKNIEGDRFLIRDGHLIVEGLSFDGKEDAVWYRG